MINCIFAYLTLYNSDNKNQTYLGFFIKSRVNFCHYYCGINMKLKI